MNTILGSLANNRKSISGMMSPKAGSSGGDGFPDIANLVGGQVQSATNNIVLEIFVVVLAAIVIILVAYSLFKPLLTGIFNSILSTLDGITNLTGDAIKEVTDIMGTTLETTSGLLVNTISTATIVINTLGVGINATISGATLTLNALGSGLNTSLSAVTTTVIGTLSVSTKLITDTAPIIVEVEKGVLSIAKEAANSITSVISAISPSVVAILGDIGTTLKNTTSVIVAANSVAIQPIRDVLAITKLMIDTTESIVKTLDKFGINIQNAIKLLSEIKFV